MDRLSHLWPDIFSLAVANTDPDQYPVPWLFGCCASESSWKPPKVLRPHNYRKLAFYRLRRIDSKKSCVCNTFGITQFGIKGSNLKAICWAAEHNFIGVLQFLKDWGITLDEVKKSYALPFAIRNGYMTVLQFFKEWGLKFSTLYDSHHGRKLLQCAIGHGRIPVVQFIKDWWNATPDELLEHFSSFLRQAAGHNDIDILMYLKEWMLADFGQEKSLILASDAVTFVRHNYHTTYTLGYTLHAFQVVGLLPGNKY